MPADKPTRLHAVPRKHAVALSYNKVDELPQIVATGAGELARQIIELAERHEIPIHEDQGLAQLLSRLQVGESVSPETFQALAEIMSFLYFVDEEWRAEHEFLAPVIEFPCEETERVKTARK